MLKSHLGPLFGAAALLLSSCGGAASVSVAPSAPASASAKPAASSSAAASAKPAASGGAVSSAKPAAGSYSFGVMIPLTGPGAIIGDSYRRGLDLAVADVNRAGGVAGRPIAPDIQDHKGTAQGGIESMNQLVNIDKVPYVVSSFSSSTLAAAPVAVQNQVLLINAGGPDTTLLNKPFLYNDQVMAPSLMPVLANYAWGEGKRNAAMITSTDGFGDGNRKAFRQDWEKLGGKIVADETFQIGASDFGPQVQKIKAGNPDVILAVAVGQTLGLIVKQARASGIDSLFVGPLGTDDVFKVAGEAGEGFVDDGIAVDPNTSDPGAKAYIDEYRQKYNGETPDWISGTMYESVRYMKDLADAVAKSGGDTRSGATLQQALEKNPQFHDYLSGGTVKIGPDHGIQRDIAIRKVQGQKWSVVKVLTPAQQVVK